MIKQDQYNALFQNARELYVKIFILNSSNKKIDSIEGVVIDGDISVDGNSTIRRTCNISLVVTDSSFLIGEDKKIWLDKRVQVEIGLRDFVFDNVVWFDMGKYIINQPSVSYSATENNLSFEALDLMCLFDGARSGTLTNKVVVDENTPIHEAIKMAVVALGGYKNVIIESSDRVVPYKIEKEGGNSIYDLIMELKDLYMDMECFIDISGNFIFQRIRKKTNDPIQFDFTQIPQELSLSYQNNYDFNNVKNSMTVWGKLLDTGVQVMHTEENTNPESPFNINSNIGTIKGFYSDDKIFNQEQAKTRAEYELWKASNLKEEVSISTIPIYTLNVNELVYMNVNNETFSLEGKFLVIGFNIPLNISGEMTIQCIKQYE